MKTEELLLLLQDIVEEDSELIRLKIQYTKYRKNSLNILKKIIIYGLKKNIFELIMRIGYEDKKQDGNIKHVILSSADGILVIENDKSWEGIDYWISFIDASHYFFILFGPYGPVGEHAFEGARIPEEFEQFIID